MCWCFQPTPSLNCKTDSFHSRYYYLPTRTLDSLQICILHSKDSNLLNIMYTQYQYILSNLKMSSHTSYKGYSKRVGNPFSIRCMLILTNNLNRTQLHKGDIDLRLRKEGTLSYIVGKLHFVGNLHSYPYNSCIQMIVYQSSSCLSTLGLKKMYRLRLHFHIPCIIPHYSSSLQCTECIMWRMNIVNIGFDIGYRKLQ